MQALHGFKRYAMEHLGGEAAVLGVLRSVPPLDPRDGATVALLQVCRGGVHSRDLKDLEGAL